MGIGLVTGDQDLPADACRTSSGVICHSAKFTGFDGNSASKGKCCRSYADKYPCTSHCALAFNGVINKKDLHVCKPVYDV